MRGSRKTKHTASSDGGLITMGLVVNSHSYVGLVLYSPPASEQRVTREGKLQLKWMVAVLSYNVARITCGLIGQDIRRLVIELEGLEIVFSSLQRDSLRRRKIVKQSSVPSYGVGA